MIRCADETGDTWDELIAAMNPARVRKLLIYNIKGLFMQADHLSTEQQYVSVDNGKKCLLTLTLYLDGGARRTDRLKTIFASYRVQRIFSANLRRIKEGVEREKENEKENENKRERERESTG